MKPTPARRATRVLALFAISAATGGAHVATASAPPSSPPTGDIAEAVPEGYVRLVDDTGFITIAAPAEWSDVDTAPAIVDGTPLPWIAVAPTSIDRFLGTFEESGVLFSALPFDPDPSFLVEQFSITEGCAEFRVEAYEAHGFVGTTQIGTACGEDGTGSWQLVIANPADQSFTALVQVQAATDTDAQVALIALETFAMVGDAGTPSSSVPSSSSVPG